MGRKARLTGDKYVESGSWKCPAAPINPNIPLHVKHNCGAHYWRELNQTKGLRGYFYCIYCFDVRWFPTDWSYFRPHQDFDGV